MASLSPLRALLIDLSGTLHVGSTPTRGAVRALAKLRESGAALRFCSNTSKESNESLLRRLRQMGFEIRDDELFTSLSVVKSIVVTQSLNPYYLLTPSALSDFPIPSDRSCDSSPRIYDSVVIGLAPDSFNYPVLNDVFRLLTSERGVQDKEGSQDVNRENKMRLIVTHKANYYRADDGLLSLGPGPFITALEEAAGLTAEIVGKPTRAFFEMTLKSLERDGIFAEDWACVAMVGDDYRQDVPLVITELGLRGYLVTTGKYRLGDEGDNKRIELVDDFAALVDRLLG